MSMSKLVAEHAAGQAKIAALQVDLENHQRDLQTSDDQKAIQSKRKQLYEHQKVLTVA